MSKMVKCKKCGYPIAKSAKVCPHCGAKANRHPVLISVSVALLVVFVIVFVGIIVSEQSGSSDAAAVGKNTDGPKISEQVIYDNGGLVISFTGFADAPSPAIGYYINLHIENDSDTDFTIQAQDVSVDGVMVPFGNCIFSADVLAGKSANNYIWITNTDQLGITQTPTEAEFKFRLFPGRDMSIWEDTDAIFIK